MLIHTLVGVGAFLTPAILLYIGGLMALYTIPAGTSSKVIRRGLAWEPQNFIEWVTRNECVFEGKDVVFDSSDASRARKLSPVQAKLAEHDFSAFRRDGYVVVVHNSKVKRL